MSIFKKFALLGVIAGVAALSSAPALAQDEALSATPAVADATPTAADAAAPVAAATPAAADAAEPTADVSDAAAPVADVASTAEAAPAAPANAIGAPPEGMGQVVFFRPSRFTGGALSFTVRENETDLGRLPNGRYFVHSAEPGVHEYVIGRNDSMRMEIEAGETYYVQNNISMGFMAGRGVLAPSDQATFDGLTLRPSAP